MSQYRVSRLLFSCYECSWQFLGCVEASGDGGVLLSVINFVCLLMFVSFLKRVILFGADLGFEEKNSV